MDRRTFITIAATSLAAPLAALAQQAGKVYRVGLLSGLPAGPDQSRISTVFRQALTSLGYVEGRNIVIEERLAEGDFQRFPVLAADLVRRNIDVIVALGTPHALGARKVTTQVPIIGVNLTMPVEAGLVATLARPGGNVTGLTVEASVEQVGKALEFLQALVPRGAAIGLVFNPAFAGMNLFIREVTRAADRLHLKTSIVEIADTEALDAALMEITRRQLHGLLIPLDPFLASQGRRLVQAAVANRLPAVYVGPLAGRLAPAGALVTWAPSLEDMYHRAAMYVDKILKGAKPGDLPVEQPTKFELVINLRTARALGLTIPPALLLRADQVIE